MQSPRSALSSPLSSLGSRTPSPPPGFFNSSSPAANKTGDMSSSPPTTAKHMLKFRSAPTTTIKKTKKAKQPKQTKRPLTDGKKSPAKSTPEPVEVITPKIDPDTGIPVGYTAAAPSKLQALLDERDSFAEYTSQLLDPNESLVMAQRLAKIQEETKKWNRNVSLHEATKDLKGMASEVVDMDEEELAEAKERAAALKEKIMEFERKVAERNALGKNDEISATGMGSSVGALVDAPEGKDIGPGGDGNNGEKEKEANKAMEGAGQKVKKRKRGANA